MGIIRIFRLYRECFDLAGAQGLISCTKYLCGALKLDQITSKSLEIR